jgi:hypothetical protein
MSPPAYLFPEAQAASAATAVLTVPADFAKASAQAAPGVSVHIGTAARPLSPAQLLAPVGTGMIFVGTVEANGSPMLILGTGLVFVAAVLAAIRGA